MKVDIIKVGKHSGQPWTFTVDGVPSLYFCREATEQEQQRGLPPDYFVRRVVARLLAGRSREVNGGPVINVDGQPFMLTGKQSRGSVHPAAASKMALRTNKKGKQEPIEQGGHTYTLDGETHDQVFDTPEQAASALAVHAFMTRGNLHPEKLAAAQAAVEAANPGKACKVHVCPKRHKVVATVDGQEHVVGFHTEGVKVKAI